jgi:hypothetical protein
MEAWSALMAGGTSLPPLPPREAESIASLADRLTRAAVALAHLAHAVHARDGWDDRWLDVLDSPPKGKSYGGALAHVITHSMHHRAQRLYMLHLSKKLINLEAAVAIMIVFYDFCRLHQTLRVTPAMEAASRTACGRSATY